MIVPMCGVAPSMKLTVPVDAIKKRSTVRLTTMTTEDIRFSRPRSHEREVLESSRISRSCREISQGLIESLRCAIFV